MYKYNKLFKIITMNISKNLQILHYRLIKNKNQNKLRIIFRKIYYIKIKQKKKNKMILVRLDFKRKLLKEYKVMSIY